MNCVSMDGNCRKPLIISNQRYMGSYSHLLKNQYDFAFQKNSWMDTVIFNQWLKEWDDELHSSTVLKKGQKLLLVVDNCYCHKVTANLSHIEIIHLPPNVTSIGQPCDLGIIRSHKCAYRELLVDRMVTLAEKCKPLRLGSLDYIILLLRA